MKDWIKKFGSRKFMVLVAGMVLVILNPSISAKTLLALPGLYIVMQTVQDTWGKPKT